MTARSTTNATGTFDELVARFEPPVPLLAQAVRRLVHDVMPRVVEIVWVRQGTVGWGTGPKKMTEHFCYMTLHRRHVNLGFYYGAELPDPHGLLGGPGKLLRSMRVGSVDDLARPGVRELVEVAGTHRVPPLPPAG